MICGICGRDFTPHMKNQLYCKRDCYKKSLSPSRRENARWFAKEWAAWKDDFANGLTASNLETNHE